MTLPKRISRKSCRDGRLRSPAHLAWVRGHECSVPLCVRHLTEGARIEAAHVRTGTDGGTGLKPGDQWAISLCNVHHAQQHVLGEAAFEQKWGIDMKALAREFAQKSPALRKMRQP